MASTLDIKGTSIGAFKIGKSGPTLVDGGSQTLLLANGFQVNGSSLFANTVTINAVTNHSTNAVNGSNFNITGGSISNLSSLNLSATSARQITFSPNDGGGNTMFEFRNSDTGIIYQDWARDSTIDYNARFILNSATNFDFGGAGGLAYSFSVPVAFNAGTNITVESLGAVDLTSTQTIVGPKTYNNNTVFNGYTTYNSGAVYNSPFAIQFKNYDTDPSILRWSDYGTGTDRWWLYKEGAVEPGSNVGGDFKLDRFGDTGSNLGTVFRIRRDTGLTTFLAPVVFTQETPTAATSGASTNNGRISKVTTDSLTTPAGDIYTLTVTNSLVTTSSNIQVTLALGTSSTGQPTLLTATPGTGSFVCRIRNVDPTAALSGTLIISYAILN